jgi:hypothetical protein
MNFSSKVLSSRIFVKAIQTLLFLVVIRLFIGMAHVYLQPKTAFTVLVMASCTVFCFGLAIEKLWKVAGVVSMKLIAVRAELSANPSELALVQDTEVGVGK